MADAPHPTAASAYPVCSIDSVHDVHATYTANGFFVMPRLLSKLQVNELASVVHSYVHRGGPLLRKNAAHSGYGPSRGGWIVLDFPSEPALFPLLAAVDESAAFHDALRGMFRGREYRLLSRNDVYVDYATGWHYDSLQRSHRLFYTFNGAAQLYPHLFGPHVLQRPQTVTCGACAALIASGGAEDGSGCVSLGRKASRLNCEDAVSELCAQSEAWREWKRSEAAPATPAAVAKQPATPLPPNARSSPRFRG